MTGARRRSTTLFFLAALTIVLMATTAVRSAAFAQHPDVLAWGLTFDLTLTIPLLHYVLLVRRGYARPATTAIVFIACSMLAARIIPRSQHDFLEDLGALIVAIEVTLVSLVVLRVAALRRETRGGDATARIERACLALFGETRVALIVASEISVLYYALCTWRMRPQRDARTVTFHQRIGWGSILACILVLLTAESIGLHLFIQMKSVLAAWIITSLDIWGALWLLGDYQALRLRPTVVEDDFLRLRFGLRWQADIPRANVASVERISTEEEWKRRDVLKVAILEAPTHLVVLREPVVVRGLAGMTKTVRAVAILPDDPPEFEAALVSGHA
jgi:hypothetical protein